MTSTMDLLERLYLAFGENSFTYAEAKQYIPFLDARSLFKLKNWGYAKQYDKKSGKALIRTTQGGEKYYRLTPSAMQIGERITRKD
jgi:hypothetical protein